MHAMELLERLEAFSRQHRLLPEGSRVLVALSGGVDSVVLAHLLLRRGQPLALAHANFQLRGQESDEDERFVRALSEAWQLPLYVERFETLGYAEAHGLSVQMAARQLRYAWFEALCDKHGWTHIATGHQLNDSVETALFHFARGTGLSGMSGIPPQNGRVVRPLLFATRADIEAYARAQQLAHPRPAGVDAHLRGVRATTVGGHGVATSAVEDFPEEHRGDAELVGVEPVEDPVRGVGFVETAHPRVVSADEDVGAAVVLPADRVPDGFLRARVAHRRREDRKSVV